MKLEKNHLILQLRPRPYKSTLNVLFLLWPYRGQCWLPGFRIETPPTGPVGAGRPRAGAESAGPSAGRQCPQTAGSQHRCLNTVKGKQIKHSIKVCAAKLHILLT